MIKEDLDDILKEYRHMREIMKKMPPRIRYRATFASIKPGTIIAQKGELVEEAYILCGGEMRVLNEFGNGKIYNFAQLSPGTYIGSYEIIADRDKFCSSVKAVTSCSYIKMRREDFLFWFINDPWFSIQVAVRMANDLCDNSVDNGDILFFPSINVIGNFIIGEYEKSDSKPIKIFLSRQEMGDRLGLSLRTVNRSIKTLKEEGYISIDHGKITLSEEQYELLIRKMESIRNSL